MKALQLVPAEGREQSELLPLLLTPAFGMLVFVELSL